MLCCFGACFDICLFCLGVWVVFELLYIVCFSLVDLCFVVCLCVFVRSLCCLCLVCVFCDLFVFVDCVVLYFFALLC